MRHIVFRGRKYKRVALNIHSNALFHDILKQVNSIAIPDCPHDDEHTRYAVLELINNSLRAHREKGNRDIIRTEFEVKNDVLRIIILDKGGGFDVSRLPYSIEADAAEIDPNSSRFQEYREANRYKRFGMGLLVARRLFPVFKVSFYDDNGKSVPYSPACVVGTQIEMGTRWNDA